MPDTAAAASPKSAKAAKIFTISLSILAVLLAGGWFAVPKILKGSAEKLASQGRHLDAAQKLKLASSFFPLGREVYLFKMGSEFRRAQNYPEAKAALEQVLKMSPNDVAALREMGLVLNESGEKEAALASFQKYLDIKQDDAEVMRWVAEIAYDSKNYAAAAKAYEDYVRTGQAVAEDWRKMGVAYFEQKDWDRAAAALKMSLEKKPDLKEARGLLGKVYMGQQKYGEAAAEFRQELTNAPEDEVLKVSYAEAVQKSVDVHISEKKFEEAIASLKEGLSVSTPQDASFHYQLANLLALRKKRADALNHLAQAVKSDPSLKAKAKKDSAFAAYRKLPAYQKAVR